jgi:hypothetical protein
MTTALRAAGVHSPAAAPLVRLGVDPAAVPQALEELPAERRKAAVDDLARSEEVGALLEEISAGADHLPRIVSGLRPLAYAADQALTDVDVHAGLEQALVLLRHKIPAGVAVGRDLDRFPRRCRAGPRTWPWSGPTSSTPPWPPSARRAP